MRQYKIHRVSVEPNEVILSQEPAATASSLSVALELSADLENHGPDGAAIVTPEGSRIYTREEYDQAALRAARLPATIVTLDGPRYGFVYSIHRSWTSGRKAFEVLERRVRRRNRDCLPDAMYRLIEGRPGKRGERVKLP